MTRETTEKIIDDLAKVDQIIRNYRETGILPDIEKDIVLTKLRFIYEFVLSEQTQKTAKNDLIVESSPKKETIKPKTVTETISNKKEDITEPNFIVEKSTVKTESHIQDPKPTKTSVSEASQPTKIKTQHAVKPEILADKFEQRNFLNEALAQYKNMFDIAKKMQNQPLHDIFSAINFNDKFLFIKELFDDDTALYQKTIEKLNASGNFNEAIQYLDQNFKWDFDDLQVQKLLELVRRRFIPGNEA